MRFWLHVRYHRVRGWLSERRDDIWRWRHRRCVPIMERRPEYRRFSDLDRVCRWCRRRLIDDELRATRRWSKAP